MFDFPASFVCRDFGFSVGFWSHWFFFFLSVFLSGFLAFVLTAECSSAFFGRVALAIMEGAVLAEIVC
ncbi:hypothetical protein F2Q70_00022311 [Brassica cretica]|uniref:Uncharacterized protein n=1 Tax=Brassica cretica TaxID=69181 RepID=A0A8S9GXA9_BRACR|nr:hypothetical protein F2Q70_00022311 [Brassica cretica]KAF2557076.1 hypothetical protein F2Q68_00016342 [Brassica cretica]